MELVFDFEEIFSLEDFYTVLAEKVELPVHFGNNLDALNDFIAGEVDLPLTIEFINLSLQKLERFGALIEVMDQLAIDIETMEFSYYIEP